MKLWLLDEWAAVRAEGSSEDEHSSSPVGLEVPGPGKYPSTVSRLRKGSARPIGK